MDELDKLADVYNSVTQSNVDIDDSSTNDERINDDKKVDIERIKAEMSNRFELVLIDGFRCKVCRFLTTEKYIMNQHKNDKSCLPINMTDSKEGIIGVQEDELLPAQDDNSLEEMPEKKEMQMENYQISSNNSSNVMDFEAASTNLQNEEKTIRDVSSKENKIHKCKICNKSFGRKDHLNCHFRNVHNKERNQVVACAASRQPEHSPHSELRKFACPICDKKFLKKQYIGAHIRDVHDKERKHICTICNKGFFKKAFLTKHSCGTKSNNLKTSLKQELGENDSYQLPMSYTDLSTAAKLNLEIKIEKFGCPICQKKFCTKKYVGVHIREVHLQERKHICTKCKRGFFKKTSLKIHLNSKRTCVKENKMSVKTLTKKQQKIAPQVSNYFPDIPVSLKLQAGKNTISVIDSKAKVKGHDCQSCTKSFAQQEGLRRHRQEVHLRVVKYGCSTCDKTFARMENLQKHLQSNNLVCISPSEEGLFSCFECQNEFQSKESLRLHMLNDHKKIAWNCCICSAQFGRKARLKEHMEGRHSEEEKMKVNFGTLAESQRNT